jgi:DNA polymerase-3 subunit beta
MVTVSVTRRLMSFAGARWRLVSKVVDATFPTWRSVVLPRSETPVVIERKALRAAVARLAAVCPDPKTKSSAARLRLSGGDLLVSAATADAEVESTLAVESGPGEARVALSARYLAEAIHVIDTEFVELHIPDRRGPVWICGVGQTENGIAVMPTRA